MPYSYARQRKAEAGLIGPVLKQLYDVIQTIDDIASNWCLHPNHLFGALPRHKLCYPPHIFIALRAAFCLSESVPEVKCKFIIIYSLCHILLQYLYRLRWPAHYVVGVLLSSFDVNGNHSICSSWEECDCEVGKETIVKWTDGHYANLV